MKSNPVSPGAVVIHQRTAKAEHLPERKVAANPALQNIIDEWRETPNSNQILCPVYAYTLPSDLSIEQGVIEIVKRLPADRTLTHIDYDKYPDVHIKVHNKKKLEKLTPVLERLADAMDGTPSQTLPRVLPFLRGEDTEAIAGVTTAYNKKAKDKKRSEGEFLALVDTKTREVVLLCAGDIYPGDAVGDT
jgi:hypothetical protein